MPGSTPATSQLDWLISTTAITVLSWSRATRDLLKSFGWGIRALHQLVAATMVPSPRRLPHTISLLEGDGFELSVPRQRRHPSATANRLSRHHFREISACASHQRLRPLRGNPPSFPGKSPVPRKGPRSTPPGPAGVCISENARASKRQLVSRLSKERRARQT